MALLTLIPSDNSAYHQESTEWTGNSTERSCDAIQPLEERRFVNLQIIHLRKNRGPHKQATYRSPNVITSGVIRRVRAYNEQHVRNEEAYQPARTR
jgi:hypothetical protein